MSSDTKVLYNGQCPVCSREMDHYAKASTKAAIPIRYDDLNDPAKLADWGIDGDQAARRLHLRKNGQTFVGIPAFIALWQEIPRYRWLARLVALPGINRLAVLSYDHLLAPMIYRWHLWRQKRA